jgi:hypothetical protein
MGIADMLITPETIRMLQRKLYHKVKQEPAYRVSVKNRGLEQSTYFLRVCCFVHN